MVYSMSSVTSPTRQKPKSRQTPAQIDRFIETARKLECDEDTERFEAKLGKIAKAKPKSRLETKRK